MSHTTSFGILYLDVFSWRLEIFLKTPSQNTVVDVSEGQPGYI